MGHPMSRLNLQDLRRLVFPVPALLDAVLTFDREHNGWLWLATAPSLTIEAGGALKIEATRAGATAAETASRQPAWVAAALLQYCFKRRIPIPRHCSKTIEVLPDGIALLIEMSLSLPPLELSAAALAGGNLQRAAATEAPDTASEADPATADAVGADANYSTAATGATLESGEAVAEAKPEVLTSAA